MYRLLFSAALGLTVLLATTTIASAASYGNFSSPTGTVSFLNVEDVNGLFGTPIATGNSLDFNPNMFEADCAVSITCPPTPHEVADTLTLQIDADAGFFIEDIMLSESGDTFLGAFGAAFAATTVVGDVFIDILEIDGVAVNGVNGVAQMVFTSGGTFDTDTEGNGLHVWDGLLNLDVDALIAGSPESGKATLVEISLSNTLTAYADSGASARIEKKDFDGLAITVVPEPGPAILMGLGLAGLAGAVRRESRG